MRRALALLVAALPASALASSYVVRPGGAPPPIPATPPLVIGPYATGTPIVCTGRDVVIRADNVAVDLRGGCRSVAVSGGRVTIKAELEPGATLWLGSPGVVFNYALVGFGPPPVVRLTGYGLHATHLERLGVSALSLPVSATVAAAPYR